MQPEHHTANPQEGRVTDWSLPLGWCFSHQVVHLGHNMSCTWKWGEMPLIWGEPFKSILVWRRRPSACAFYYCRSLRAPMWTHGAHMQPHVHCALSFPAWLTVGTNEQFADKKTLLCLFVVVLTDYQKLIYVFFFHFPAFVTLLYVFLFFFLIDLKDFIFMMPFLVFRCSIFMPLFFCFPTCSPAHDNFLALSIVSSLPCPQCIMEHHRIWSLILMMR